MRTWIMALICAVPLMGTNPALSRAETTPAQDQPSLGTLRAPTQEKARSQALDWLKGTGKTDPATMKEFEALWSQPGRPLLDLVADTFALGDAEAGKLLAEARNPLAPAPTAVPDLLKDAKRPAYFRANLGLAYAKALSNRRVYEESLEVLRLVKPDQVVDPATYFFHRAVAEHALLLKADANRSIVGVLEDVADAPERYKVVAVLMSADMKNWKDKDLGEIARKMDNIERRLDLARGGPKTQKMQKEVVARLDELIKKIENQSNGSSASNGGACPGGKPQEGGQQAGGNLPTSPMNDSNIVTQTGAGKVDQKRLAGLAKEWGKLPEKDRAKAMLELTRDMPPRHREIIENYIKKISEAQAAANP